MQKYEYDTENENFRKVRKTFGGIVLRVIGWLAGLLSMSVVFYFIASFFVSTDTEKKLIRQNRQYEAVYGQLFERQKLLEDVCKSLEQRDNAVYGEIFQTAAPSLAGGPAAEGGMDTDTVPERHRIEYTAMKAASLKESASKVEDNFTQIFRAMTAEGFAVPPMSSPLEEFSFTQTAASVGEKISPFYKVGSWHGGLDLIAGQGTPVLAAADGTVCDVVRSGKGLGNVVEIDHGNGYRTRYAQLLDVSVSKGQKVARGRKVGTVGISGNSLAPHLHYEVLRGEDQQDPVNYLFAILSPEDYANVAYMSVSTGQSLD